jgi:hypothetical protein
MLPHRRPNDVLMGRVAMTVLRLRKAAEQTGAGATMWRAIEPDGMSTELTEDGGVPNALHQLPAPGMIADSDLEAKRLADVRERDERRREADRQKAAAEREKAEQAKADNVDG